MVVYSLYIDGKTACNSMPLILQEQRQAFGILKDHTPPSGHSTPHLKLRENLLLLIISTTTSSPSSLHQSFSGRHSLLDTPSHRLPHVKPPTR
jgi:hypothetical protein